MNKYADKMLAQTIEDSKLSFTTNKTYYEVKMLFRIELDDGDMAEDIVQDFNSPNENRVINKTSYPIILESGITVNIETKLPAWIDFIVFLYIPTNMIDLLVDLTSKNASLETIQTLTVL